MEFSSVHENTHYNDPSSQVLNKRKTKLFTALLNSPCMECETVSWFKKYMFLIFSWWSDNCN